MRGVSFDKARGKWVASYPGQKQRRFASEAEAIECREIWEMVHGEVRLGGRPLKKPRRGVLKPGKGVYYSKSQGWVATGPGGRVKVCDSEEQARDVRAAWERGEELEVVRVRKPAAKRDVAPAVDVEAELRAALFEKY